MTSGWSIYAAGAMGSVRRSFYSFRNIPRCHSEASGQDFDEETQEWRKEEQECDSRSVV